MNGVEFVRPAQALVDFSTRVGDNTAVIAMLACAAIIFILCPWK